MTRPRFSIVTRSGSIDWPRAKTASEPALALQGLIPNCELSILPGAGHACQLEQPWLFDHFMRAFLRAHRARR